MTDTAPTTSSADVDIDAGRLREMRQNLGLTQGDLARICEINQGYLSQLENGRRLRVSPPLFVRLCDALEIPAENRRILRKVATRVA